MALESGQMKHCRSYHFNAEQGLRIIGYDTKKSSAAIIAFKRHFIQTDVNDVLDQKTINNHTHLQ
jgi:N-acetylmuramoyl-L-alanine amidase